MAKTPLRALRVPDELWRAAQTRARDNGETVSGVVRRALVDYVDHVDTATTSQTQGGTQPALAAEAANRALAAQLDSSFLLAQGMMMQRHGLGVDEAAAFVLQAAATRGTSVDETVQALLERRTADQPEAADRRDAADQPGTDQLEATALA